MPTIAQRSLVVGLPLSSRLSASGLTPPHPLFYTCTDLTVSHDEGSPPEFCAVKWMALGDWDAELTPYVADFKRPCYDALRLLVEPVADELLTE